MCTYSSIQLGILIVSAITVIVSAVFSFLTIRNATKNSNNVIKNSLELANKQHRFQFFSDYTRRYQDLVLHMPPDIEKLPLDNDDVRTFMRLYFDLCSEEFYLHSQGVIDDEAWMLWIEGMKMAMKREKFKTAWKSMGAYYHDQSFVKFMHHQIMDYQR